MFFISSSVWVIHNLMCNSRNHIHQIQLIPCLRRKMEPSWLKQGKLLLHSWDCFERTLFSRTLEALEVMTPSMLCASFLQRAQERLQMRPTRPCDVFFSTAKLAHAPFGLVKVLVCSFLAPIWGKTASETDKTGLRGALKLNVVSFWWGFTVLKSAVEAWWKMASWVLKCL